MRLRGKVRCSRNRICLLKEYLSAGVAPKDVVKRILRSRARYTICIEKASLVDDLNKEEDKLGFLEDSVKQ